MKDGHDSLANTGGNKSFTRKNVRDGGLVISLMIGMMAFAIWYLPISTEQLAQPILDQINNAKSCQDLYHADVKQFMIPIMISLNPQTSKKLDDTFQTKLHLYCSDLYVIEKKYGDLSDTSKMTCDDLKIVIKNIPSDMIKNSVTNDYVSRCLT